MAQNELVIQAISSCPLPEIRRTFVSDEAFSAGVDSWIRANNDPAQVAYADRADEINEECLMNLRIAENAMSAAAGEVTKESAAGGVLTRAALDALPPADRGAHFRAGGTVTD